MEDRTEIGWPLVALRMEKNKRLILDENWQSNLQAKAQNNYV